MARHIATATSFTTALAVGALASAPAWAQQGYNTWGRGWDGHMMGGWMGPFAGLLWMIAVAAIVVGAILLIRYLWTVGHGSTPGARGGRSEALELLDKRYAAGEIEREEYLKRKEDLQR